MLRVALVYVIDRLLIAAALYVAIRAAGVDVGQIQYSVRNLLAISTPFDEIIRALK